MKKMILIPIAAFIMVLVFSFGSDLSSLPKAEMNNLFIESDNIAFAEDGGGGTCYPCDWREDWICTWDYGSGGLYKFDHVYITCW